MSSALELLVPSIRVTGVDDGFVLESTTPLPAPAPHVLHWLDHWATASPSRTFLAERDDDGSWSRITYAEALHAVGAIAASLVEAGAGPERAVLVLSDNSVRHALIALAAMHVGAPVVPVSPAYSLASSSFRRLRHIAQLVEPAVVYVESRTAFAAALAASSLPSHRVMDAGDVDAARARTPIARHAIGADTIAKILFTSGSTGEPKGVVNTHAMLTANQESLRTCWPFLAHEVPVIVDWLPWSHTFGGNHNFHLVLRNGGTLYIDRGRPAPGLVDVSLRNLADVGPTIWFNVPRGFDQAVDRLEADEDLARAVFRNLRVIFYAAAALGASTRARLESVARRAGHAHVFFTSAWGSTETAPLATSAHFETPTTGVLGVPVPGVRIKLARVDDRLEIRVHGPNVTPGYWQRGGGVEPAPRDRDGFLPTGDAGRLVTEGRPDDGIAFAGRISENFKLSSGTWVNVGAVRLALVDACAPWLADAVIAGHDREALGALLIQSPSATASHVPATLHAKIRDAIAAYNCPHPGSSERIRRAMVLEQPLSLDEGETTDKGYTNQRRVLERRSDEVTRLFASDPDGAVMTFDD